MNVRANSRTTAIQRPTRKVSLRGRSGVRQAGITTLGMLIIAGFVGIFSFGVLRLTPVYLNYMKVAGVLSGVHDEFDGQSPSRSAIRISIQRRFDVESVSEITARDIVVKPEDNGFLVQAVYDHKAPFISNINFLVSFDRSVHVRR